VGAHAGCAGGTCSFDVLLVLFVLSCLASPKLAPAQAVLGRAAHAPYVWARTLPVLVGHVGHDILVAFPLFSGKDEGSGSQLTKNTELMRLLCDKGVDQRRKAPVSQFVIATEQVSLQNSSPTFPIPTHQSK
jgi:hypothetical protein